MSLRFGLAVLTVLGHAGVTYAEHLEEEPEAVNGFAAADASTFTPTILRGDHVGQGFALASSTFNNASNTTTLDVVGEFRVWNDLHLVLRADDVTHNGRPGVGAGYQFANEKKDGVSSTAYLFYKTEGFTEVEGEIEAMIALDKHIGPVRGVLNLAYGQDADAKERDGEVAVGLHTAIANRWTAGVVGRYRDALGSGGDKGITRDAFGGLAATVGVGPLGLTAMAGVAGISTATTSFTTGPAATLAVGGGF